MIHLWWISYFVLWIIALVNVSQKNKVTISRAKFDESLNTMNLSCKNRFILGYITIFLTLFPILDLILKSNPIPEGEKLQYWGMNSISQIFKVDYTNEGPILFIVLTFIFLIGWIVWMSSSANYKEENKIELKDKITEKEERQAEEKAKMDKRKADKERFVSELSSKYGKPDVSMVDLFALKNSILTFPETQYLYIEKQAIKYKDIISCEIKDESYSKKIGSQQIVTKNKNGSTLGRAIVGGLIAGPAGAIIGGATSKKESTVIDDTQTITFHHYYVVINISDTQKPVIKIDCGTVNAQLAEKINSIVQGVIVSRNADTTNSSVSVADELLKLASLKEKGIISQEEFEQQKQKLLS